MKKKTIAVAALASCIALTASFTGCSLVSTNNSADMAQEIATVDITLSDKFAGSGLADYKEAIKGETSIVKRDLVSYFLNVGYSYVQNGYPYETTFNMLLNALIENAVLVQYSTMKLLEIAKEENANALTEYNAIDGGSDRKTQILKYEYLLDNDNIQLAKYKLYSSVNSAIDNEEKTIIAEDSDYVGTDTRTTPVNLETEQDDYYPSKTIDGEKVLDYNIYTGFYIDDNHDYRLSNSGAYADDALEGTTKATRVKAYNTFLKNLKDNSLIEKADEDGNLKDVLSLGYLDDEYISQLESRIINKYLDAYEEQQAENLLNNNYIQNRYEQLLEDQRDSYKTASAFESALSNMSSSSFLLYSPVTSEENEFEDLESGLYGTNYGRFGFVYNILLPFDAKQNGVLTGLKSILSEDEDYNYYYNERNRLLKNISTVDQREAWFNGATDYSFKVADSAYENDYFGKNDGREYLFFEGNLTNNERYKSLQAYDGRYSYNGKVYENEDGSYTLLGNELDINGMLTEFSEYIDYVLGGNNLAPVNYTENYYGAGEEEYNLNFYVEGKEKEKEIDYSKFLYAWGNVDFGGTFSNNDLLNANAASNQYKAMSAVNELQFAYTTDTGVLSQYIGYSVSAYETSYIKEFEYAAKLAISNGAGAFTVCAGDYGWHLIYVTYVFDEGENYSPVWSTERIEQEGTFENLFFEWIKGNDLSDVTTPIRTKIINDYSKEDVTVIKYQKRYQDLLDLDSNS